MRYLVFAFKDFYPQGGWSDFQGAFPSLEEAKEYADNIPKTGLGDDDEAEVVDLVGGEVVYRSRDSERA